MTPSPGDTYRPALRRAPARRIVTVTDDAVIWADDDGDEYRNSLESWYDWVARVGARREAAVD